MDRPEWRVHRAWFFTPEELCRNPFFHLARADALFLSDEQRADQDVRRQRAERAYVCPAGPYTANRCSPLPWNRMLVYADDCLDLAAMYLGTYYRRVHNMQQDEDIPVAPAPAPVPAHILEFVRTHTAEALQDLVIGAIVAGRRAEVRAYLMERADLWAEQLAEGVGNRFCAELVCRLVTPCAASQEGLDLAHEVITSFHLDVSAANPHLALRQEWKGPLTDTLRYSWACAHQQFHIGFFRMLYLQLGRDSAQDAADLSQIPWSPTLYHWCCGNPRLETLLSAVMPTEAETIQDDASWLRGPMEVVDAFRGFWTDVLAMPRATLSPDYRALCIPVLAGQPAEERLLKTVVFVVLMSASGDAADREALLTEVEQRNGWTLRTARRLLGVRETDETERAHNQTNE